MTGRAYSPTSGEGVYVHHAGHGATLTLSSLEQGHFVAQRGPIYITLPERNYG